MRYDAMRFTESASCMKRIEDGGVEAHIIKG
jgi:hypothetical protein